MTAAVVEHDTGADDEVLHRARHEHLAWPGQRRHAGSKVDREASDVVGQDLDLTDVDARPDLEPKILDVIADGDGAADRAGRAVERREEPVADDGGQRDCGRRAAPASGRRRAGPRARSIRRCR